MPPELGGICGEIDLRFAPGFPPGGRLFSAQTEANTCLDFTLLIATDASRHIAMIQAYVALHYLS